MDGSFHVYKHCVVLLIFYLSVQLMVPLSAETYGGSCPEGQPVVPLNVTDGEVSGIFDDLTAQEIMKVVIYMKKLPCFNIQDFETVTINSTYIALIELMPPNKSDALLFLTGKGAKPLRYAKVVLYRGDAAEPVIEEYKVGPVPEPTNYSRIIRSKWRNPIPYNLRPPTAEGDTVPWNEFICRELAKVESVLKKVIGYSYSSDCKDRCLTYMIVLPGHLTKSVRSVWISLYSRVKGFPLYPIGFQFRVNINATNSSNWNVDFVWFRNQSFNNMEHFIKSFTEIEVGSGFAKYNCHSDFHEFRREDSPFGYSTEKAKEVPLQQRGPRSYMPDGRRFSVTARKVEWLRWSFYFNIRSTTGIQLHDIRFDNQRIVYELSLQEILTLYSGASHASLSSVSLESMHQIGTLSPVLSVGIDCPEYASYFNFIHYIHNKLKPYQNAVCLFEMSKGVPLKVHHQRNVQRMHDRHMPAVGLSDDVLVLRTVVVTDWHEYVLSFIFHQNAVLEVTSSISGTVQSVLYTGLELDKFGFHQFSPNTAYSNNKHFINFKVDLDINGHKNRFEMLEIGIDKMGDKFGDNNPPAEKDYYLRHFKRKVVDNENSTAYSFDFQYPKYLLFYANASNRFGTPKAYRLVPLSIQSSKTENLVFDKSMAWTKNQVTVTKHKDDEDTSSTGYNAMDMLEPVLNFQSYIDGEPIVDEDLIAWVTLESLYIPHTEPGPTVEMTGSHPSFILQPFNYFDTDPAVMSPSGTEGASSRKEQHKKNQISPSSPELVCRPVLVRNSASFCLLSVCLTVAANVWISCFL